MSKTGREIRLRSRPENLPTPDNFALAEVPVPQCADGHILVKNCWMSVDPYMRGRMRDVKSYVEPFRLGEALDGACVGEVIESKNTAFKVGDCVMGMKGWRDYWISDGSDAQWLEPSLAPIQAYLGVLGMPGMTAYVGLDRVAQIKAGETVFVSGAAGAVGSTACQIARLRGCRVIGSAGSQDKIRWLLEEAKIDHAFNYKEVDDISRALRSATPDGIDVYFENVGGEHLDAAIRNMNNFGRIAVCGMISRYNDESAPPGPRYIHQLIGKRIRMEGFIVWDHREIRDQFVAEMAGWIRQDRLHWRETVVHGLENALAAFIGLFKGENVGKMLVKL